MSRKGDSAQCLLRDAEGEGMQFASLIAFSILALAPAHINLSGTWALDRLRSDFGAADAPRQLIVRVEQTDHYLGVTTLTVDDNGQRITYRECHAEAAHDGTRLLLCAISDSTSGDEEWQVTPTGELAITRVVTARSHIIRQRLVLARSTLVE